MKNCLQVIHAVDACDPVTDEELRLAMKCLSIYAMQADKKIMRASGAATVQLMKLVLDAKFNERLYRAALMQPMLDFLTPRYTPGTPEFKKARAAAEQLMADMEKRATEKKPGA